MVVTITMTMMMMVVMRIHDQSTLLMILMMYVLVQEHGLMVLSQKKIEDEGIKIVHAFSPIQINKVILQMPESSGKQLIENRYLLKVSSMCFHPADAGLQCRSPKTWALWEDWCQQDDPSGQKKEEEKKMIPQTISNNEEHGCDDNDCWWWRRWEMWQLEKVKLRGKKLKLLFLHSGPTRNRCEWRSWGFKASIVLLQGFFFFAFRPIQQQLFPKPRHPEPDNTSGFLFTSQPPIEAFHCDQAL